MGMSDMNASIGILCLVFLPEFYLPDPVSDWLGHNRGEPRRTLRDVVI